MVPSEDDMYILPVSALVIQCIQVRRPSCLRDDYFAGRQSLPCASCPAF